MPERLHDALSEQAHAEQYQPPCAHGYLSPCRPALHATCAHCSLPIRQTSGRLDLGRGTWLHDHRAGGGNGGFLACPSTVATPPAVVDAEVVEPTASAEPEAGR